MDVSGCGSDPNCYRDNLICCKTASNSSDLECTPYGCARDYCMTSFAKRTMLCSYIATCSHIIQDHICTALFLAACSSHSTLCFLVTATAPSVSTMLLLSCLTKYSQHCPCHRAESNSTMWNALLVPNKGNPVNALQYL